MIAKELRTKSKEELNEELKSLKKEIESTMENIIKGKEKNLRKMKALRKDIARVHTVLKEEK
jgi:large subunit ribosomal protein L29